MAVVEIQITSDFICPWCWIGHRHLTRAINQSGARHAVAVAHQPFELNPEMPKAGVSRRSYRTAKFGSWERSQARDIEVETAGRRAGLDMQLSRIEVTPNTRIAHRLMAYANTLGDESRVEGLYEAIFAAYFARGEHIGTTDVLVSIGASVGLDAKAARTWLDADAGEAEVVANEMRADLDGIRAVPTVRIGNTLIQGAQPVPVFLNALDNELMLSVSHKA